MKKHTGTILVIVIFVCLLTFGGAAYFTCVNPSHRGAVPVNPYCTKCGERDGIVMHDCQKPQGPDVYCAECGKYVILH